MTDKLLEVSMMLGDAIEKLNSLSAYKDPYKELKEAQERGEVIQAHLSNIENPKEDDWTTMSFFAWDNPAHCYRIKPKEKKKLYLWAYQDKVTKSWKLTDRFVEQDYLWVDDFYRLDSTMIEVEDE